MLTKREVYERYIELESSIKKQKEEQKLLLEKYVNTLPYKVGDLVEIKEYTGDQKIRQVYIGGVMAQVMTHGYAFDVRVAITFNKVKKNGMMSNTSAGIYYHDEEYGIKVIKPA